MMKASRAAVFFLLSLACGLARADVQMPQVVFTSAINVSAIPSRSSGVAPLAVFFDASATTSGGVTSLCFHECEFRWNFGDAVAGAASACGSQVAGEGSWACGAGLGANSKNLARGPVAAHVFESAGTYSVCPTITDGTNTITFGGAGNPPCIIITVSDPDTVYSTTNTICFANGPSPDFTGCPAGATQTANSSTISSALASVAAGKRLLFKRGDTWTSVDNAVALSLSGPWTIGAFGSGAKPIIQQSGAVHAILTLDTISDGRIMDLTMNGGGATTGNGFITGGGTATSQMTFLRLDMTNGAAAYNFSNAGPSFVFDQMAVVDGKHSSLTNSGSGYGFFGYGQRVALLGNKWDTISPGGGHVIRWPWVQKGVIGNSTFTGNLANNIKIAGPTYTIGNGAYAEKSIVADNDLNGAGSTNIWVEPQADFSAEFIRDIIVERNWLEGANNAGQSQAMAIQAQRVTVRNNLINVSGAANFIGISIEAGNDDVTKRASDVRAYNNTCYSNTASTPDQFRCVAISALATDTRAQNNLGYAPSATSPHTVSGTGGGTPVVDHNSTDPQTLSTSPSFTTTPPTLPAHFKPTCTVAYPCAQGTPVAVWSDFSLAAEPATRDIGAVNH